MQNRLWILSCCAALIAGCLAPDLRPSPGELVQVRRVVIVPMEGRPLSVQPHFGAALPVLGLAAVAANREGAGKAAERQSRDIQGALEGAGAWQPNVELAKAFASRLTSSGIGATVSQTALPLPGITDRSISIGMENWLGPVREWFGDSRSSSGYAGLDGAADAVVVEVCLLNYELRADSSLVLRVLAKVVSPRDSRVIARASAHNLFDPGRKAAVAGSAADFRQVFGREADRLAGQVISELGLAR